MNEISKELMCILIMGGPQIWIEKEKLQQLKQLIEAKKTFEFEGELINPSNIAGVFSAKTMEEVTRRKNGQWKDTNGVWRNKGDQVCKCGNVVPWGMKCGNCRN